MLPLSWGKGHGAKARGRVQVCGARGKAGQCRRTRYLELAAHECLLGVELAFRQHHEVIIRHRECKVRLGSAAGFDAAVAVLQVDHPLTARRDEELNDTVDLSTSVQ